MCCDSPWAKNEFSKMKDWSSADCWAHLSNLSREGPLVKDWIEYSNSAMTCRASPVGCISMFLKKQRKKSGQVCFLYIPSLQITQLQLSPLHECSFELFPQSLLCLNSIIFLHFRIKQPLHRKTSSCARTTKLSSTVINHIFLGLKHYLTSTFSHWNRTN